MRNTYDEAIARLHETDPEYESWGLDGLSNHGPMAAEALFTLGHAARIEPFLEAYTTRLRPRRPGREVQDWASALGDPARASDWIATFEAALEARSWRAVLRESIAQLSAGVLASALHGWIRVAHAVRALEREDTPVRRRELAHGLGLWATRYQSLPGEVGAHPVAGRGVADVIAALPRFEVQRRGLIFDALRAVETDPRFAAAVESWDPETFELHSFVRDAAAFGAARVIGVPGSRIAFVHVITGASALRIVAPHLEAPDVIRLAGHLLQVVAALEAVYGEDVTPDDAEPPSAAWIRARAGESLDDHAVKLAETALREHALEPSPLVLRASQTLLAD